MILVVIPHPPFWRMEKKMADVALKHVTFREDTMFYFYEGELPVKKGTLVIDDENQGLVRRAYALGYRLDPETEEEISPDALQNRLETGSWDAPEPVAEPEGDDDDEDTGEPEPEDEPAEADDTEPEDE